MNATMELVCYAQIDARIAREQAEHCIAKMGQCAANSGRTLYLTMALEKQEHAARMAAIARRLLGIVE